MAEYIEREEALRRINFVTDEIGFESPATAIICVKDILRRIPASDVAPVRHGRWESKSVLVGCMKFDYFYECTACRRRGTNYQTNYCPNCGARMDLEE